MEEYREGRRWKGGRLEDWKVSPSSINIVNVYIFQGEGWKKAEGWKDGKMESILSLFSHL